MRFVAEFREYQSIKDLLGISLMISKLTKECVVQISEESILFVVAEESDRVAPRVWFDVCVQNVFSRRAFHGLNDDHNFINLTLNPSNLGKALSSAKSTVISCKIKLTNDPFTNLKIEIEQDSTLNNEARTVTHNIPISIISEYDYSIYEIPKVPKMDYLLILPPVKIFKNIIDQFKKVSPTMSFLIKNDGNLHLTVDTDDVTISNYHSYLKVFNDSLDDYEFDEPSQRTCTIDCKKLSSFISSLTMQSDFIDMICGIQNEKFMFFTSKNQENYTVNCIIPAVCF
ncbi:HUS1 family protein [Megaselia abdita]